MKQPPDPGKPSFARSRVLRVSALSGIVLILVGSVAWLGSASLDTGTMRYFGPGMLPRALSIFLLAIGAAVLVLGIRQKDAEVEVFRASLRGPCAIAMALLVFAATIRGADIGGIRIPQLGLVVAGPLAVIIAGYASHEANIRDLGALALGLTAGCAALFHDVLGMAIPILPKGFESAAASSIGWLAATRVAYVGYAILAVLIVVCFPQAGTPSDREARTGA